ncbi:HIG1 domain family member 2A [Papilio machaon]|uniref:HIG1 domain family member 2A n=1 Tax=Papilio machaon TaxID=76193 RepID=A0A194RR32_PAPMA|nr:PREDICTED: HIG1 domain family member 2A, mitochondrial [Papilio polytes]XP_014362696.1 HIG1 domain family member 2A, mitochondrial [Papilio machaon]KPJ19854.1 HIG1 domain family member 2A [Papilio machaon]
MSKDNEEPTDLDWIQLRRDMGQSHQIETFKEKFVRKFGENPFVPIGCLATAGALSYGLWCFRTGRTKLSQQMMRMRIVAQGFTITALVVGVMLTAGKSLK